MTHEESAIAHWRELRARVRSESGDRCADCAGTPTRLRRITFVSGDWPTAEHVRFLCDPCHQRRKPIPFFETYAEAAALRRYPQDWQDWYNDCRDEFCPP